MTIDDLLREEEAAILDEAWTTVTRLEHYQRDGAQPTRRRLEVLHRELARAVRSRDLHDLVAHAHRIALRRQAAGYDLREVQAAFTALEEAIWRRALARLPAAELAFGLGRLRAALAHLRDEVRRTWVAAAPGAPAPGLDVAPVLDHTAEVLFDRFLPELVHPV